MLHGPIEARVKQAFCMRQRKVVIRKCRGVAPHLLPDYFDGEGV